ncbi:type II secretion system protein GspD [Aggregicoccus sp. 17bor-14]|uniref:type II secretion system secretin GspD n=1 Tax=Myxococcaceae TaxID=31 RepID=UPI00129D1A53|nr:MULTISPECIES: type II secretion system secretin GspD [Myxococcaceae]MBF5044911.1 type II secretion system secretin GspD [Simulacricoccus sp. 17bor-14]MRI90654.1 type II secretion system protein GspD [Aggregicoccus sp. 17bor-14]
MKTLSTWTLPLCLALALPALAQRRPGTLPPAGAQPVRPTPAPSPAPAQPAAPASPARGAGAGASERQITPAQEAQGEGTRGKPTCEQARRNARYGIYFDKVDIEKLIQTVSDATCRSFILPENVRGKISIIGPENGRLEVGPDEFYSAFLAALDANGLAVYPSGRFLKIVDKRSAKQNTIPTIVDPDQEYTLNEQMITRLFKIRYADVEPLRGVLQQLVSKDGDTIPYPPDTIIVNDVGSNIHRLEKIVDQLDTRASSDEVRVLQVRYASAQDVAGTIQKIFEAKSNRPGQRAGTFAPPAAQAGGEGVNSGSAGSGGPATLSQIIPDERTNKLIIVASPAAFERIGQLVREIDVPISGEGRINVYRLANANSEDIASTLQSLAQGTSNRPRTGAPANIPGVAPRPGGSSGAAELFSGEVKISADKGTNSLVIVASQSDYRNIVRVIEELDQPRRQVFVEAVIMEVNLDRKSDFGINLHSGYALGSGDNQSIGVVGTNYNQGGLPPSTNLANLASFGGFLAGLQGPVIPELKALGIPSFGVILHALQTSSDVNVLSTPHLLTSDNEEAEITVGQNVPFQAGFSPSSVGSALGNTGVNGANGLNASILGSLGGLGSLYAPITRQNVELKLTIKPQINESEFVRLVIAEQTEEIASNNPTLGPTTSKRSAKTTVVAKDQETVVLGGIMQDRTIESVSKVPILGDVPIIGHLFRQTTRQKTKTNLLLFLTPYIIKDSSDFRRIFERKMKERQQFVEQFYGQVPGYEVAVDFQRKPGPLGRMNRSLLEEETKAENGGPGAPGQRIINPAEPASPGEVTPSNPAPASPPAPSPTPAEPPSEREDASPESGSSPSAPVQEPPPERIRVQPDSTSATRS